MITIAYVTSRTNCHIEWFFDSLQRQAGTRYHDLRVVVVDFFAGERGDMYQRYQTPNVIWVKPKPSVWQGEHRLTTKNYFAAANARNTAICYAPDGHIAFADDLSVLMPGWLECVFEATKRREITFGRYQKVTNLEVQDGLVVRYDEFEAGKDSRFQAHHGRLIPCTGQWMYGCSFVTPIGALLQINGFDEDNDSMGGEDTSAGIMLGYHGYEFVYDQGMLTLESDDLHLGQMFERLIKPNVEGVSTFHDLDASWAMLRYLGEGRVIAPNYCNLRELRARILEGGEFPVSQIPDRDWRDGQLLSEM